MHKWRTIPAQIFCQKTKVLENNNPKGWLYENKSTYHKPINKSVTILCNIPHFIGETDLLFRGTHLNYYGDHFCLNYYNKWLAMSKK